MHSLPEANFLNPAVMGECGTFIGLPAISSIHLNFANSGFRAGDVMVVYTDGGFGRKNDFNTDKMAKKGYFISEIHAVILAIGLRRENKYYSFTITEKNNLDIVYTRDMVGFALRGSTEYEGQDVVLKGSHLAFNHLREYAFGFAKEYSPVFQFGIKAKLLFGIYNFNIGNSSIGVHIEETTRDIAFDIDGGYNSSMPGSLRMEPDGTYRNYKRYESSTFQQLMNMRNPGIALDAGFIYRYSDQLTFSGSLLDLGLIYYTSNLTNYTLKGNHQYTGSFGNGQVDIDDLWDVFDELNNNMDEELSDDPYVFVLDPKLYLGATWHFNNTYSANALLYNRLLPGKLQTGFTLSGLAGFSDNLEASMSWSYMNGSLANLGLGLSYGKNPAQIYLVTDNIFGFILPMSVKNVNLRFGINLNLGCSEIFDMDQCGCAWLRKAENRRLRQANIREKLKKDKGN